MAISRELTQKVRRTDSDEENEEDEEDEINMEVTKNKEDKENKILLKVDEKIKTNAEVDEFVKLCREYFDAKQQTKREKIEKNGISDEIMSEEEKKMSCHNEESSTSHANKNDTKNKLRDNKKSSTSQANKKDMKNKLCDNKKSSTSQANKSDTKSKSCSNEKSSTSLVNTIDMKDKVYKAKKNKEKLTCDNVGDKQNNKKFKSRDTNEMLIDSKGSKKGNLKRKLNLKAQEAKKKLKANNKMEKHKEKQKENKDYSPSLEFEDPKRKPILDSPLEETISRENVQKNSDLTSLKTIANTVQDSAGTNYEVEIDPKKYVNIKPKHLKTQLPNMVTAGDDDSEQEEETHRIMSEAFADDDVVEEFRREKEEEVRNKNFKSILCTYIEKFTRCHIAFKKHFEFFKKH